MNDKPFVTMCAHCQHEFPEVNKSVREAGHRIAFSHGICERHSRDMLKQMGKSDEEVEASINRIRQSRGGKPGVPDLKEHPELVKQYSQGIFTPEDYKKAQEVTSTDNIKEFFQKRAGLIS